MRLFKVISMLLAIMFMASSFVGAAEAKTKHHVTHHVVHHFKHRVKHHGKRTYAGNIGGVGVRFVRGRLICAINVSNWLRAHGFHSPSTRSSKAFLKYAKVARANVLYGDIHFNYRKGGGHVMIALGGGKCLNPSSKRQTWVVKQCPAGGTYVRT